MVGRWCSMAGGANATANHGTSGTGGPSGGRTVHLPSPTGEGIKSPTLTLTLTLTRFIYL